LPAENEANVKEDLQSLSSDDMEIHYVHTVDEALGYALGPAQTEVPFGVVLPQGPTPASPAVH
jgi:hypothetical protein